MTRHKRANLAGMMPKAKSVSRPAGEPQPQPHLDSQPSQPGSSLSSDMDEQIDVANSQICIKTVDLVRLTTAVVELKETVRKQQSVINQLQLTTGNEVPVIDNEAMINTVPNISGPSFPSLQTPSY